REMAEECRWRGVAERIVIHEKVTMRVGRRKRQLRWCLGGGRGVMTMGEGVREGQDGSEGGVGVGRDEE
ncbi:hypothetical protein HAX54_046741, partial [Datura stramonium]|nr:hypothetical protein [Datura stramonium]